MTDTLEKLRIKKELFEELLSSIKKATEYLAEDNVDEFDRELQNCGDIMRKVDELGDAGDIPVAEKLPSVCEMEKDIERIAEQVAQANKACRELSEEKLKGYGGQIKSLRQKKQGLNSYNQTLRKAVFVDAKK